MALSIVNHHLHTQHPISMTLSPYLLGFLLTLRFLDLGVLLKATVKTSALNGVKRTLAINYGLVFISNSLPSKCIIHVNQ